MTVNERYKIQAGDEIKFRYGREGLKWGTVDYLTDWGMMFTKDPIDDKGGYVVYNAAWKDVVAINGQPVSSTPKI